MLAGSIVCLVAVFGFVLGDGLGLWHDAGPWALVVLAFPLLMLLLARRA